MFFRPFFSELHKHADCSWRCVQDGNPEFLNHSPPDSSIRVIRRPFREDNCRPHCKRAIYHIGVTGYPAGIRSTPEDIVFLQIEHILRRVVGTHHIPATGVNDTLGSSRGTAGIEDEQRVLCIHHLGFAFLADIADELIVIDLHLMVDLNRLFQFSA